MYRNAPKRPHSTESMNPERNNIDRQILAVHHAIATKLIANPGLIPAILDTIEQRYAQGLMRHGAYLSWSCLMENVADTKTFLSELLEDSATMRSLRRQSPLIGVLNEQERQSALTTGIEIAKD